MKDILTDIQRFSLTDGPGIRTTVFFKGCNMRCLWCHNPETLSPSPDLLFYPGKCIGCGKCLAACPNGAQKLVGGVHVVDRTLCKKCGKCAETCYAEALVMSGKEMSVEEILNEVRQDKTYYESSGGGVTLSGGEVLCHIPFAVALADACHAEGISVAIESNLSFPCDTVTPLLERIDLVMADIKLFDDALHKKYTGVSNKNTLDNIRRITDIPLIVRTPLIPGVTATRENLTAIAAFLSGKKNLLCYQLLNFNPLGTSKYEGLDKTNAFADQSPFSETQMRKFGEMLADFDLKVKIGE